MNIEKVNKLHLACASKSFPTFRLDAIAYHESAEGMVLEATDGRILARIPAPEAEKGDEPGLIPAAAWREACEETASTEPDEHCAYCGSGLDIAPATGELLVGKSVRARRDSASPTLLFERQEGRFPKTDEILDWGAKGYVTVNLDAELLYRLSQALGSAQLRLKLHRSKLKPVLVRPIAGAGIGAIMPLGLEQ